MYRFALTLLTLSLLSAQPPERGVRTNIPITVQRKLALVIGNAKYAESPLRNSINDASAMAQTLHDLKFDEVTERHDLTIRQMRQEIDGFAKRLRAGDLGLFYFAGHGMQVDEQNYLIPIDFTGAESDLPYEAYPAAQLRDKLQDSGARLRVLILDSCRNNPFRTKRDGARGLAPMSSAEGTFIAYATAENGVADDGPATRNGLFTGELLRTLQTPDLDLKAIFERTKEAVYQASDGKQRPYTSDGVVGQFYFLGPVTIVNNPPPTPAPDLSAQFELAFWNGLDKNDAESLRMYLKDYPSGRFVALAHRNLARLAAPAPPPSNPLVSNPDSVAPPPNTVAGNPATPRRGSTKTGKDGLEYVWIDPGTFRMGCSQGDSECFPDESPAHPVTISGGFYMGKTPVTQAAYQRVMGNNPSHFKGDDSLPVEQVSWNEARDDGRKAGMRLPTEPEWEYAARAGSTASRYGSLDAIAWYSANSGSKTHPVGLKQANAWGLYDMLGNVWQWMADWYGDKYYQPVASTDPTGPPNGTMRALRGGSWINGPQNVRVSYRRRLVPVVRYYDIGLRCVGE